MPRTLWREFMDGPILQWSLWPCLSPSVPLFIKARRVRRFKFSTIHHLISVIIFLSVNHLEVIYFDSQHVPCNFPPSLAVPEKSELLVHNCRSVSATVDLHIVSVRPTGSWRRPRQKKKCFIATHFNKRCLQELLEVNTSGCQPVKSCCICGSSFVWTQASYPVALMFVAFNCCPLERLYKVSRLAVSWKRFPFLTIIVGDSTWILAKCCNMASHFALIAAQHSMLATARSPFLIVFDENVYAATAATNSPPLSPTTYLTIWSLILSFFILASFSTRRLAFTFALLAHIQLLTKHSGILPSCRWHTFYAALRPPYMRVFFYILTGRNWNKWSLYCISPSLDRNFVEAGQSSSSIMSGTMRSCRETMTEKGRNPLNQSLYCCSLHSWYHNNQ